MPMVRKLTAWVALEGHLSSSAPNRPPGSTWGTFSSSTSRVAAMAKTPSLKAYVRLVLKADFLSSGSIELLSCRLGKAKQVSYRKLPGLSPRKHRSPAGLDLVRARIGFQ